MVMPNRLRVLFGVAGLLAVVIVLRVFFGGGGVTVDFEEAPLAKVLRSLSRQVGTPIETNLPLDTLVTLKLRNAPSAEAIDILAVRLDADWQLAYLFAPDQRQIDTLLASFRSRERLEDGWKAFGGGGGGMMFVTETATDPRGDDWKVESAESATLTAYLQQGGQKTRALLAHPPEWEPTVVRTPKTSDVGGVARSLAKSAKGTVREVFLISGGGRGDRGDGERQAGAERPPRTNTPPAADGTAPRWGGGGNRSGVFAVQRTERGAANPQWTAERMEQAIKELPVEEREVVQRDLDEMRQLWEEVRALPEEERRERIGELMSSPAVQERMEERMAARDAKRTPEQRHARQRRYIERKIEAREKDGRPMAGGLE